MLDLGAIGKGYAIERRSNCYGAPSHQRVIAWRHEHRLRDWNTPGSECLGYFIEDPEKKEGAPLAKIPIRDEALSVSAVWGKSFQSERPEFRPCSRSRTGCPAGNAMLAAVVLPSATETDALSTALLVVGPDGQDDIVKCGSYPVNGYV